MSVTFCVSCDQQTADLKRDKNISSSQAFKVGIYKLASEPMPTFIGETIEEPTKMNKVMQSRDLLQNKLFEMQDLIDELKKDKGNVQS